MDQELLLLSLLKAEATLNPDLVVCRKFLKSGRPTRAAFKLYLVQSKMLPWVGNLSPGIRLCCRKLVLFVTCLIAHCAQGLMP